MDDDRYSDADFTAEERKEIRRRLESMRFRDKAWGFVQTAAIWIAAVYAGVYMLGDAVVKAARKALGLP